VDKIMDSRVPKQDKTVDTDEFKFKLAHSIREAQLNMKELKNIELPTRFFK
jgi:hypothetical protein